MNPAIPVPAAAWRQGSCFAVVASLPSLCLLAVFAHPTANLLAHGLVVGTVVAFGASLLRTTTPERLVELGVLVGCGALSLGAFLLVLRATRPRPEERG